METVIVTVTVIHDMTVTVIHDMTVTVIQAVLLKRTVLPVRQLHRPFVRPHNLPKVSPVLSNCFKVSYELLSCTAFVNTTNNYS